MNIRKTQSGKWEIRAMVNGKNYSKTIKGKKPTQYEADQIINELVAETLKPTAIDFRKASLDYIKSRENVVSPATVREYTRMIDRLPEWYTLLNVYDISQIDMQKLTNELSINHKSKTVHNLHGFCVAVIRYFRPEAVFNTTFKQNDAKTPYIPTKEEVQAVIDYSIGTEYHIPLQLAKYSLRRSEICALTKSDLTPDNQIHVCKALVQDINKEWVVKLPKTEDSDRYVPIDDELANEIRNLDREQIYPFFPENLSNYLTRIQKKLGLPHFSIHKLRHFFASTLHGVIPEADIMNAGGWKNPSVLREIYTHASIQRNKATQQRLIEKLS